MRKILFILIAFCLSTVASAQDFPYEKASPEELGMKVYDKDTSANALVLNEFGKASINETYRNDLRLTFEYHTRIKIFNHKGFSHGTIELLLRNSEDNNSGDDLENIEGITSYMDDNGVIQTAELDKKSIYRTKINKYWTSVKFAMPGLHDGCVTEFRYILSTPFFDHFHNWQFQSYIPKLHTEYEAHIPGFWTYKVSLRGPLKLSKDHSEIEKSCFSARGSTCDCLKLDYVMTNVPAFVNEEYMTSPKNYLSVLNFDLEEYTNFSNGAKKRVSKEWQDVDRELKQSDAFGNQLKKTNAVKEHIPPAILSISNNTEKAKAIYKWAQNWFKWNNFTGIYSTEGVKKAIEARTGSIADINLTLIDALNSAGINTDAVLLSTRDHGFINRLYPVIGDFNYVIARANIDSNSFFLDATDPLLPFGTIPEKCLNDSGRVFSMNQPSYWTALGAKQRKTSSYTFDLTLQEDGKLKGKFVHYSIGYDAYLKRKQIKKFNSTDEYIESVYGRMPRVKILKSNFSNLDSLNDALAEEYEVEIDTKDNSSRDHFSINPYRFHKLIINPFKLAERNYPVDMGMATEDRLFFHLHVPEQYTVASKPQNQQLSLSGNGGTYITSLEVNNNNLTFSSNIRFNKIIFPPDEYAALKEFYNKIILAEKSDITFTKK